MRTLGPTDGTALHTGLGERATHDFIFRYGRLGPKKGRAPMLLVKSGGRARLFEVVPTGEYHRSNCHRSRNTGDAGKKNRQQDLQDHRLPFPQTAWLKGPSRLPSASVRIGNLFWGHVGLKSGRRREKDLLNIGIKKIGTDVGQSCSVTSVKDSTIVAEYRRLAWSLCRKAFSFQRL